MRNRLIVQLEDLAVVKLVLTVVGLFVALVLGHFGLSSSYWMEAKNGPVSTVGKSGEMKSPGGSTELQIAADDRSRMLSKVGSGIAQ